MQQKDLEKIEAIMYKFCDDIAISLARSLERLEEKEDAREARIYGRLSEIEDKVVEIGDRLAKVIEMLDNLSSKMLDND